MYTTHNWVDVIIAGNIVVWANEIIIADHSAILLHECCNNEGRTVCID